jgi:hypothetical protein
LLERRLREYRERAVISRRSAEEADALEERLVRFGELVGVRESLTELAAEVDATIERIRRRLAGNDTDVVRADIEGLRARIHTGEQDAQWRLDEVRTALGDLGVALKRTRHRGVFRVGNRFVVPFFNEVGIEERREFSSLAEAHSFRRSVRLRERGAEEKWSDAGVTGTRQWGAEQGILPPRRDRR